MLSEFGSWYSFNQMILLAFRFGDGNFYLFIQYCWNEKNRKLKKLEKFGLKRWIIEIFIRFQKG